MNNTNDNLMRQILENSIKRQMEKSRENSAEKAMEDPEEKSVSKKRCYTVPEIAEILGVSRPSVYALIKRGEFAYNVVGGKYIISKKSFDEWLDNGTSKRRTAKSRR